MCKTLCFNVLCFNRVVFAREFSEMLYLLGVGPIILIFKITVLSFMTTSSRKTAVFWALLSKENLMNGENAITGSHLKRL